MSLIGTWHTSTRVFHLKDTITKSAMEIADMASAKLRIYFVKIKNIWLQFIDQIEAVEIGCYHDCRMEHRMEHTRCTAIQFIPNSNSLAIHPFPSSL